jgi:hypothetical protein
MTQCDAMGYLASGLVLVAFGMKDIVNGLGLHLTPIWLLHAVLLPLNVWRLTQALASDLPGQADPELRPPERSSKRCRKRPQTA